MSHMRSYLEFCDRMKVPPLPVTSQQVCRYAAYLSSRLAYSSLQKYLNALRILHLECDLPNPLQDNWTLNTVLKGIKRDKGAAVSRKLPVTPQLLLRVRAQLRLWEPRDLVFWTACLLAFFGLFRKSNLLPASTTSLSRGFTRADVAKCTDGLALRVTWSKTIQFRERQFRIPLPFLRDHPLCPATPLLQLMALGLSLPQSAPLLSYPTPTGLSVLTQPQFTQRLRSILAAVGVPPDRYSGHSFRRGGVTWAFQCGLPGELIQILGDWKSEAYKTYLDLDITSKFTLFRQFSTSLPSY